jgi:putative ABC transport system permease protein
MFSYAVRDLAARRRRAGMTALAVLIGVSMIAGTFVFTDTIHAAFRQLFTNASKGADVIVASRQDTSSLLSAPATMPVSLLRRIRALPGVADAQGQISDVATIVGRNGKVISSTGSPTLAISDLPPPFGGLTFVQGGRPAGPHEVALDEATAARQGYHVGDLVRS